MEELRNYKIHDRMKTIHHVIVAATLLAGNIHAATLQVFYTPSYVSETEPFIRFLFRRDGDLNLAQTVDYATVDDSAVAGEHYTARGGTVTFAVGQNEAVIDVPLIDNGLVDGDKAFWLLPRNATSGLVIPQTAPPCQGYGTAGYAIIRDNELPPTRVDPSFFPDHSPRGPGPSGYPTLCAAQPDGRILISGGPYGIVRLQPNGWMDPTFKPGNENESGYFTWIHTFNDGALLTIHDGRFVRLLPSGTVDGILAHPVEGRTGGFLAAQPDRKLLVESFLFEPPDSGAKAWILRRLNEDGSPDNGFAEGTFSPAQGEFAVTLQPDGRILVTGGFSRFNGVLRRGLVRLNADGSLDNTFAPFTETVEGHFLRSDGKIVILAPSWNPTSAFLLLRSDGSVDPGFSAEPDFVLPTRWLEHPDGRLLVIAGEDSLIRLNKDLSRDRDFSVRFPHDASKLSLTYDLSPCIRWQSHHRQV